MNLRKTIRTILLENVESLHEEFRDFLRTVNFAPKGYNLKNVTKETFQDTPTGIILDHFTLTLQHVKPDFKRFVEERASQPGRMSAIYGDTPTSKTMITRWLTGFRDGADINERQKSAAIKIAQLTGLDAIQELVIDPFESKNPGVTVVANFTGAKTKNKGLSFFEVYVFPAAADSQVKTPKPPIKIPVDDEVVEIPVEPVVQPKEKPRKRKSRKNKKPKLTRAQKKAGYNQIDQDGRVRHVTHPEELENIADHIVDLVLGYGPTKIKQLPDPMEMYTNIKNRTYNETHPFRVFRVIDDYYEDDAPILKMYKGYAIEGGQIRSRSMMQQYTSLGSNRKYINKSEHRSDPNFGRSFADGDFGNYTPPKLGGKEAKDARRFAQKERANDEIILYASIHPKKNKFTGHYSIHTGKVTLYLFLLDRNLE